MAGDGTVQPTARDWAADDENDDDEGLPPLAGDWAEDDDEELPPLEGAWADDAARAPSPAPPQAPPKERASARPAPTQHQPPLHRGGSEGSDRREPVESPWNRGGNDAAPPQRDPPRRGGKDRGRGEAVDPHELHRREIERARAANRPVPVNYEGWRVKPGDARTQAQAPAPAHGHGRGEVHYPTRDEQRAAALRREEEEAWKSSQAPLAEFFGKAPKGEPFPPEACRELLNALSEPPFAEGRLAPRARLMFTTVSAHPKALPKRGNEEIDELVRGVIRPLYHLLTYGVTPPPSGTSSVAASIAGQMHTAAVKVLSAALDILAAGEATHEAVEMAKGVDLVREQVVALLSGKAPAGGKGDRDARSRGTGGGARGGSRGGMEADRWGKAPDRSGGDRDRDRDREWDRDRDRDRDRLRDDRRRSLDDRRGREGDSAFGRSPGSGSGGVFSRLERPSMNDVHAVNGGGDNGNGKNPTPKVVITRPFSKPPNPDQGKTPPAAAASRGHVFSRLEGAPTGRGSEGSPPVRSASVGSSRPEVNGGPGMKGGGGKSSHKSELPHPRTELPHPRIELPHPKPVPAPAKTRNLGDVLDEELEKASGRKGKGGGGGRREGKSNSKSVDVPHPKPVIPTPHVIPAPKPIAPKPSPQAPAKGGSGRDALDDVLDEELEKALGGKGGRGGGGRQNPNRGKRGGRSKGK